MTDNADALVVLTTIENQEDGERLARLLIENALAACVQILPPMISIYRWQGAVERATEILLLIKTTRPAYQRLETMIKENHPYQTPEIIALPVEAGLGEYLSWLAAALARP
ncbi:MAG: divalent-cation tolerance protein CutA [Chloracidobacterium sp.]|nr:divalent-cation tolerance protein CutA [Chloracidobacterium sp.]